MRNLKRALSLVMAAAMLIGMMVVGASASYSDFTDTDEIVNTEAVATLVELNVINGKEDGSYFDPTGIVTRAEMAKMITVALHGGKDPVLGVKDTPSFTDIKGTWAESYIEYCSSDAVGVISGRGDGTFDPTATVTASEAAKMLLVAIGYKADVFKLTGASWQINTDVYANQAGLYEGLAISSSAPLTRDNAAQMIYNGIQANLMVRSWTQDQSTGKVTESYNLSSTRTILTEKFGVVKVTGVVTGNEFADIASGATAALAAGKTNITVDSTVTGIATGAGTFNVSSGEDVLGRSVTLFVKPAQSSTAASRATVVGGLVLSDSNKVVEIATAKTATQMTTLLDDEKLAADTSTKYIANFNDGAASILTSNAAGVELTLIDNNNDGKLDYVLQFAKGFGQVTNYSTAGKGGISVAQVNGSTAFAAFSNSDAAAKIVGFDTVALNDYVLYYNIDGKTTVEKVEPVEVTVSAIKGTSIVADGVTYAQSGLVATVDGTNALTAAVTSANLGKTIKVYLDGGNNVLRVADVESAANFLLVEAAESFSSIDGYCRTKVVLADGTETVVNAYTKDGSGNKQAVTMNTAGSPAVEVPTVFTYSVDSDGNYFLTALGSTYTAHSANAITKGTSALNSKVANDKTVFVVKEGTAWTVYTGIGSVPSMTSVTSYGAYKAADNTVSVMFVTASSLTGASSKSIYLISGQPTVTKDGTKTIYTYDAVYEGAYTQLTATSDLGTNGVVTSGLYENVTLNGTEITTLNSVSGTHTAAAATENANGLIANGGTKFTYDEKTVVVIVDKAGTTADEMVQTGAIGSIIIDSVNSANTSNIIIVPTKDAAGLDTGIAGTIYIVK